MSPYEKSKFINFHPFISDFVKGSFLKIKKIPNLSLGESGKGKAFRSGYINTTIGAHGLLGFQYDLI